MCWKGWKEFSDKIREVERKELEGNNRHGQRAE